MITPIEHARSKEAANKYKVEPYVVAADVYGESNLAGRGGWTWYTGSSSWYYQAGIEYILGFKIENNLLKINPCIPKDWNEVNIRYKFGRSIYNIKIYNLNKPNNEIKTLLNGNILTNNEIKLVDDGKINEVVIQL